jgi:hypothetical protein
LSFCERSGHEKRKKKTGLIFSRNSRGLKTPKMFDTFPPELLIKVASYLNAEDTLAFSLVCHQVPIFMMPFRPKRFRANLYPRFKVKFSSTI